MKFVSGSTGECLLEGCVGKPSPCQLAHVRPVCQHTLCLHFTHVSATKMKAGSRGTNAGCLVAGQRKAELRQGWNSLHTAVLRSH